MSLMDTTEPAQAAPRHHLLNPPPTTPRLEALLFIGEKLLPTIHDRETHMLVYNWLDEVCYYQQPEGQDLTDEQFLDALHVLAPFIRTA